MRPAPAGPASAHQAASPRGSAVETDS